MPTTTALQLLQPPLSAFLLPSTSSLQSLHHHCQKTTCGGLRRRRSISGLVFVGKEDTQLRVTSTESDDQAAASAAADDADDDDNDDDPSPQDLEDVAQIKRVLELLRKNRDMIFSEVKLTIMIEDPREVERRRLLGIDDSEAPTRDDLAAVLEEVNEGKIPKNRVALRMLAEEMAQWPNLEVEVTKKKKKPGKSPYAKTTDTGVEPEVAAKRLNIDWDSAADIKETDVSDNPELPSILGFGALYLVTAFPVIIGISVVLILFYNSLQ
ncbi:hypothetical protein RHSIM_Rhsim02G0171500 [Rhododendron simsii]|uniref:Ycf3-interacting protein 1, chloroplastic n=1 Tax=Rhododendron simsii TaxID=118357 RepID=A0A834HD47_RHOSS|nr:hypothetical protein RHSIM_Rhsim02G0171500 [Rhododendron simsii]